MALSSKELQTGFTAFFKQVRGKDTATSYEDCAAEFVRIYESYALKAQDPSGDPPLSVNTSACQQILNKNFKNKNAQDGIKKGLVAFWTGATFKITLPAATMSQESSSVVVKMNSSVLDDLFNKSYEDPVKATSHLSKKLHQFTTSVEVLITGLAKAGSPPPVVTLSGKIR